MTRANPVVRVKKLHHGAMEHAENARQARLRNELELAVRLTKQAFELEKEAALLYLSAVGDEPTRSILLRSASSLAYKCGDFREAEKMASAALAGDPPEEIADELRDLIEQATFERHLDLRGKVLDREQLQLSISGREVGHGIVATDEFLSRVKALENLVYRTAERRTGLPYRDSGVPARSIRNSLEVFVASPEAASFAVTMRIGRPHRQPTLFDGDALNPQNVIDNIVLSLQNLNTGNEDAVRTAIQDRAYYQNFVGLARIIAPDGGHVKQVGLTVIRDEARQEVSLTKPRKALPTGKDPQSSADASSSVTVEGLLKFADDRPGRGSAKIVIVTDNKEELVVVPEGMMADIVKPLWDTVVIVEGIRRKSAIHLETIRKAD